MAAVGLRCTAPWRVENPVRAWRISRPSSGATMWKGEPYTCATGTDWKWFRSRMLGGRTNAWGRISLRNGPYDFKPYSRDGKGFDWPITYEELAPYYDKTEELIGVFGSAEGMENLPDGKFLPAANSAVLRTADPKGLQGVEDSLHSVAAGNPDASAEESSRCAIMFRNAIAAAAWDRTSLRRTCCCIRRSLLGILKSVAGQWRGKF